MMTQTWIRVLGMILLAMGVSMVMLGLIYALQNLHALLPLASIGWNGVV
jgi:hypothetical protein